MSGDRGDGRRTDELRPARLLANFTDSPVASVLCEMGRTRVLCTVSEEAGVPRWLEGAGRGWISAMSASSPTCSP